MAQPMYQPGYVQNPELSSLKSLLNAGKIIALIFWILGILWVLAAIAGAVFAASFGFTGAFLGVIYPLIFFVFNLLIWIQLRPIEEDVDMGRYQQAKDKLLLWAILGIISGIVVGILLIIAYTKFDGVMAWRAPPMVATPVVAAPAWGAPTATPAGGWSPTPSPGPAVAPAAAAPSYSPQAAAAAPAAPTCPRCGRPATWIAQYSRWYCYTDQQYL